MALAEDEAVALGIVRSCWVHAQDAEVQRREDVESRELAPEVTEAGLVDHAQVPESCQRGASRQLRRQLLAVPGNGKHRVPSGSIKHARVCLLAAPPSA